MLSREETALSFFKDNFNCAQSVLSAFCDDFKLDGETALKLASGFGGGFRCGEVCGAVSGALMVIGLKLGHFIKGDSEQKQRVNKKTLEFMERFAERNGTYICRDLLGYDMRDEQARLANHERHKEICPKFISCAVNILESEYYPAEGEK